MQFRAVTYLLAVTTLISHSAGELIITPRNTETKVGDTTYFNCSTNVETEEIFWYHGEEYIYNGFGILEPYDERFEIDRNASNGSHNLVIHSAEPSDAGEYICIDQHGLGRRRSAELVVLDNDPDCQSDIQPDGIIGQNIFNIPPDEAQLTCNVSYYGNIPPQMEWKNVADYSSVKDSVTANVASNNRFIYTLNIKGDISLDNSTLVCHTKRSTKNQYKCTSETIRVLYFLDGDTKVQNAVRGDRIICIANNNTFPCTTQWYHDDYVCPFPCDEAITAHLLGVYLCTVKCQIRGKDYFTEALKVFVVEATTSTSLSSSGTSVPASVVSIVVIVVILSVVPIVIFKVRKRRMNRAGEVPDGNENPITVEKERVPLNTLPKHEALSGFSQNKELPLEQTINDIKEIPQRIPKMPVISGGTSGEIYGPFDFQNIKCACQQILVSREDVTSATEDDACGLGRRWESLSHINILKFYGVLFQYPAFYAVMDYAEGGSVRKILNSCKEDLEVSVVHDWATQIADGMNYLHGQNIVHGGLKAAQILSKEPFHPANPSPRTLKIASYRLIAVGQQSVHASFKEMYAWMDPETIGGEPKRMTSDVWSYGVTVWEILTRAIPHEGEKQAVLFAGNLTLSVPNQCHKALRYILNGCWQRDREKRPTSSQIVSSLQKAAGAIYENSP